MQPYKSIISSNKIKSVELSVFLALSSLFFLGPFAPDSSTVSSHWHLANIFFWQLSYLDSYSYTYTYEALFNHDLTTNTYCVTSIQIIDSFIVASGWKFVLNQAWWLKLLKSSTILPEHISMHWATLRKKEKRYYEIWRQIVENCTMKF